MRYLTGLWQCVCLVLRMLATGRFSELAYEIVWRAKGLDLSSVSSAKEIGFSHDRGRFYRDSGGPVLTKILRALPITERDKALDMGCGKGGAVLTLAQFPFAEVAGFDLSSRLVEIARANAVRLRMDRVRFICSDASEFTDLDEFTYIYLYDPFPCATVEVVLNNIGDSLKRRPRDMTLIYCNPICHDSVMQCGLFRLTTTFKFRSRHRLMVYNHSA